MSTRPSVSLPLNVGDGQLTEKSGGILKCAQCPGMWCKHIQIAIMQGDDEPQLSLPYDGSPGTYLVPMFPTQDVFLHVQIAGQPPYYRVIHEDQLLGFISKTEGRRVIRNMLVGYLTSLMDDPANQPSCSKLTHDWKAKYEVARYEGTTRLIDFTCRSYYNSCLYCIELAKSGTLPYNDDDLVPDAEGRRWSD